MKSVQDIFDRLQEKKNQVKVVRRKYKDELGASSEYQKITEELDKLRAKKKVYEQSIREQSGAAFGKIDDLALAIRQDTQMLSDVALTSIMKGERVEVKDQYSGYEPVFTVRFKRTK
ncbi:MAG: hypothetical protein KBC02_03620 [Candidatus Pacebacteria bacterium]|nr:hypothetical protein [Candidatus Paceibacterota bacterium]